MSTPRPALRRLLPLLAVAALAASAANPAAAQNRPNQDEVDPASIDARYYGYDGRSLAPAEPASTATAYLVLIAIAAGCVGVTFMNAKRNLD